MEEIWNNIESKLEHAFRYFVVDLSPLTFDLFQVGPERGRPLRRAARRQDPRYEDPGARDGGLRHEGQVHHPQAEEGAQLQAHGRRGVKVDLNHTMTTSGTANGMTTLKNGTDTEARQKERKPPPIMIQTPVKGA